MPYHDLVYASDEKDIATLQQHGFVKTRPICATWVFREGAMRPPSGAWGIMRLVDIRGVRYYTMDAGERERWLATGGVVDDNHGGTLPMTIGYVFPPEATADEQSGWQPLLGNLYALHLPLATVLTYNEVLAVLTGPKATPTPSITPPPLHTKDEGGSATHLSKLLAIAPGTFGPTDVHHIDNFGEIWELKRPRSAAEGDDPKRPPPDANDSWWEQFIGKFGDIKPGSVEGQGWWDYCTFIPSFDYPFDDNWPDGPDEGPVPPSMGTSPEWP